MEKNYTVRDVPPNSDAHSKTAQLDSGKFGKIAIVFGILAVITSWVSSYVGPAAARQAIAQGDLDNVYTVQMTAWGVMIALDLVAIVLGALGARRPVGKVLSGAAIAIGVTGLLGLLVHLIQTGLIGILF